MSETEQERRSSDDQTVSMPQPLSLRWKLLQVVGAALIALAILIDWPAPFNPSLQQTSSFLLLVGVLVGVAGFIAERVAGS